MRSVYSIILLLFSLANPVVVLLHLFHRSRAASARATSAATAAETLTLLPFFEAVGGFFEKRLPAFTSRRHRCRSRANSTHPHAFRWYVDVERRRVPRDVPVTARFTSGSASSSASFTNRSILWPYVSRAPRRARGRSIHPKRSLRGSRSYGMRTTCPTHRSALARR